MFGRSAGAADPTTKPGPDMKRVLDALPSVHPKPDPAVVTKDMTIGNGVTATVCTPKDAKGPCRSSSTITGGGFVIATNKTCDASPRFLSTAVDAVAGESAGANLAINVAIAARTYEGVTHEFFGMGTVVAKAKDAEEFGAATLKAALK